MKQWLLKRFTIGGCAVLLLVGCFIAAGFFPISSFAQGGFDSKGAPAYGPRQSTAADEVRVFAFNRVGLHYYDPDYSVFSILPPFNVVRAQVIEPGTQPQLLDSTQVQVFYKARKDPKGSINTTSRGKTNFWRYAPLLYGISLPVDFGLLGARMPGPSNEPRPFTYDPSYPWFIAPGIPITSFDDEKHRNLYPLMDVFATIGGQEKGSLPTVVPVANEMVCGTCHLTGGSATSDSSIQWSDASNPTIQSRLNILLLHDARVGTHLYEFRPVRCSACHYDPIIGITETALDESSVIGQGSVPALSIAVHGYHAEVLGPGSNSTCYSCHPNSRVQLVRGVHHDIGCIDCHGNLEALGNSDRTPWFDEPRCDSCHTGDAVSHLGDAIILEKAYNGSPSEANFRKARNQRFAQNPDKPYRNSFGHYGVACEACHGSPHAEWPSRVINDNLAPIKLQGYASFIMECRVCHLDGLPPTLGGPHGMHNVNDPAWYGGAHATFYYENPTECKACHGGDLNGTVLSKVPVERNLGGLRVPAGREIACWFCHPKPGT